MNTKEPRKPETRNVKGDMPGKPQSSSADTGAKPQSEGTAAKSSGEATERPVKTAERKKTTQYVVTVDNSTGVVSKIEKLDEQTGARTELTRQQYAEAAYFASMAPYMAAAAPAAGSYAFSGSAVPDPQTAAMEAYYRAVTEYLRAIGGIPRT